MSRKYKKILVTGADGFIGSHLTEELVRRGVDVRAFVYYNSFNSWGWLDQSAAKVRKSLDVFSGDVRDPHGVRKAMEGCDAVLHLASLIGIPYSYHSPDSYVETNMRGTLNLLQAAREKNIAKFIHTSTSEVYGTARYVPIDEAHPLQAQSPYSATKIAADQLATSFYHAFNVPVTTIRPFNTYGPRQSARAVIPTVITQIASGQKKIKLGVLHPTRDFTYVADTVSGFIAALDTDGIAGETINLGGNFEISIGDTVRLIAEVMKADIKVVCEAERLRPKDSEVERLWSDNAKAKRLLGWSPKRAGKEGFREGLAETARWFTHPENLTRYKTDVCNI